MSSSRASSSSEISSTPSPALRSREKKHSRAGRSSSRNTSPSSYGQTCDHRGSLTRIFSFIRVCKTQEDLCMAKTHLGGLSKSGGIQRVPYAAGIYEFEVESFEESSSKNGDPMFIAKLKIGSTYPDQPGSRKVEGKPFTARFVVISGHDYEQLMVDKLKDFLNAAGVRVASDDSFSVASANGKTLYGEMTLGVDKRDGTMSANDVRKWYSPDAYAERGGAAASSDED